jgi:hypothetical protein
MSHGPEHHLEEAEHAQHARHDPFDRRVALSMAILAAALASVTLLGHRSHGETLQNQIYANDKITDESNKWAYYQAKKNRMYLYESDAKILNMTTKEPDKVKDAEKQIDWWKEKAGEYKKESDDIEEEAHDLHAEAERFDQKSELAHHRSNFFDVGELGLALALVLCSVSLLTKRKAFWYSGLVIGLLGFAVAIAGFWAEPILRVFGPYIPSLGG